MSATSPRRWPPRLPAPPGPAASTNWAGSNRQRPILELPGFVGALVALPLGLLPRPLVTRDQLKLLSVDNVVSADATKDKRTLVGLGIGAPRPLEAVLPFYLWRFSPNGQFDRQTA
jgi:NADH dehydrogenase